LCLGKTLSKTSIISNVFFQVVFISFFYLCPIHCIG
jgi:hypothetical protein